MDRDQIIGALHRHESDLKQLGAARLFLFGSASRNELGPASDVDLFFDFDNPLFSLIELVSLQDRIADLLHMPADVMSRESIHPRLRSSIEASAIRVF